jgi:hypothetical protein
MQPVREGYNHDWLYLITFLGLCSLSIFVSEPLLWLLGCGAFYSIVMVAFYEVFYWRIATGKYYSNYLTDPPYIPLQLMHVVYGLKIVILGFTARDQEYVLFTNVVLTGGVCGLVGIAFLGHGAYRIIDDITGGREIYAQYVKNL